MTPGFGGTGTSSPAATAVSAPTGGTGSSTPRRLSPSDKRSSSATIPGSSALTASRSPSKVHQVRQHDPLGARGLADFEADRRALLARVGLDEPTLRRAVDTAKAGLDALDRFGSDNWDARLRATDQLFSLAGVYPSRSPSTGGTRVEVLVAAPEWLATMVKSK